MYNIHTCASQIKVQCRVKLASATISRGDVININLRLVIKSLFTKLGSYTNCFYVLELCVRLHWMVAI